ncbi:MAG: relaxase/mobilization nuclease domain-containing protein [Sulfuricella sp.]
MQKISRGKGFRGALDYAFEREGADAEPGRLLGGNMSGQNARQLAAEFGQVRRLRPDIEKPVWHNALRLPKGEKLNDVQWVAIADDYMKRMGFTEAHPRAYVLHDDAAGQHIHIVASRVSTTGKVYLGKNENLASTRHIQALEREYGLTITKGPTYDPETGKIEMPEARQLKKGEIEAAVRTGQEPPRQRLQRLIDDALAEKPTAPQLAERLTAAGVTVRANMASTGRCNGLSFELDGVAFKGSALGKTYGWKGLQERGLSYEQDRDRQGLGRYRAGAQSGPAATTGENLAAADANLRAARRAAADPHHAAGNLADRAARRAVGTYLAKARRDRGEVAGLDCGEDLGQARRQAYKARMLAERYKVEVSAALADQLAYVRRYDDYISIKLKDGGRVIDRGDRLSATTGSDAEILAMIELAKAKGFKSVEPRGSDHFKLRAYELCTAAGLPVRNYAPPTKEKDMDVMDALADLTAAQATTKPAAPAKAGTLAPDPYLAACRAERRQMRAEIDKRQAELSKLKPHDVDAIRKQAFAAAQASGRWKHVTDPVRDLRQARQMAEAALAEEQARHAHRGWLAKATGAGKLAKLEREAVAAKTAHLAAAKVARAKLDATEDVRGPVARAEADNQHLEDLARHLDQLEHEERELQALEKRLQDSDGKELLQRAQASRNLDAAERRILEQVRAQEQAERQAEEQRQREEMEQRQEQMRERLANHLESKPKGPSAPAPR